MVHEGISTYNQSNRRLQRLPEARSDVRKEKKREREMEITCYSITSSATNLEMW